MQNSKYFLFYIIQIIFFLSKGLGLIIFKYTNFFNYMNNLN